MPKTDCDIVSDPQIVFVNRFYAPDEPATAQLLTDLAEGLARSGYLVTVYARHSSPTIPREECRNGVRVRRIRTSAWGRHNLAGRVFDFTTFLLGVRRQLRDALQPGDVLIAMTDPPMLGTVLADLARRRQAHLVQWIQDIFPEVAMAVSSPPLARALRPQRNQAWQAAARCVVPGQDMAGFVRGQNVSPDRITIIPNWAPKGVKPEDGRSWRDRHGLAGRFVVMYSGNLGRVHDFSTVIPLAEALRHDPSLVFVFVGDGAQRAIVEKTARKHRLAQILFLPAQPREQLGLVLSSADVHLITLREGCENLVFPSKLYGIAAAGRPALVIGPAENEPARLVRQYGFGQAFTRRDVPAIAEFLSQLKTNSARLAEMQEAALAFARAHGQFEHALTAWKAMLTPLIPLAGASTTASESTSTP